MKFLIERANIKNNDKILDFGCGTAHLYEFLKKKKLIHIIPALILQIKLLPITKKFINIITK